MDIEDIIVFVPFIFFLLFSIFGKVFTKPNEKESHEKADDGNIEHSSSREAQLERRSKSHLKPVPQEVEEPDVNQWKVKQKSLLEDRFIFEDQIQQRSLDSSVGQRHISSSLEEMDYRGLLQERFTGESISFAKGTSKAANLLRDQKSLKSAIILAEILEKKF